MFVSVCPAHLLDMTEYNEFPSPSASPSPSVWGLETLIDISELAAYLGVPVSTIYDWRVRGKGPAAYRFGKHLKFAVADVRAWVAAQREPADTADPNDQRGRSDRR